MSSVDRQKLAAHGTPRRVVALGHLIWFSARTLLWQRQSLLAAVLLVGPIFLTLVIRMFGSRSLGDIDKYYWGMTLFANQIVIIPMIVMLFTTALVKEEAGQGTLVYLLSRRLSRPMVYLGKLLGVVGAMVTMVCVAQLVFYHVMLGLYDLGSIGGASSIWWTLLVQAVAVVVYGSVFGMLGLLLKRPQGIALVLLLVFEVLLALVLEVYHYSVNYYLRGILFRWVDKPTSLQVLEEQPAVAWIAVVVLASITVTALVISLVQVSRGEFTRASEIQA